MTVAEDYFARVRPLLGEGLSPFTVEVDDAELALDTLELLASCMLERIVVTRPETAAALLAARAWKQPFAPLRTESGERVDARIRARRAAPGDPASITWSAPRREVTLAIDPTDRFTAMDASYHCARTLREILLGRAAWPDGKRWLGDPRWPFSPRRSPPTAAHPHLAPLAGRHILVIGLGSLGSEAMRALAGHGARWTVVDGARVSVFNLARQWYGAAEVGDYKVYALQRRVGPDNVRAWRTDLDASELTAFEALLTADPPDVAVLATGTHHHGMLGELLWRRGIPHVAACCYPQARFFEVSVVSPREATPCLHCFRGHIYRGAPEPAPMADEVARFLYQPMEDAARTRAFTDLVAEPATRIETVRPAELLARCVVELCARERSPWFRKMLDEATTCLLGGNTVSVLADGSHAYGISEAGQVLRLGLEDIAGATDSVRCEVCGRQMEVVLREPAPAVAHDADADAALLEG